MAMRRLTALIACAAALPAAALDYRSLGEPAVMYDSPSQKGQPLYVIARYTPVEVVVAVDAWLKVRDAEGSLAWVERRLVADKRTLIVRAERAQVRGQADDKAAVVFEAEKNVVLEFLEAGPAGWAKVKHRDGQGGYVSVKQVWGP